MEAAILDHRAFFFLTPPIPVRFKTAIVLPFYLMLASLVVFYLFNPKRMLALDPHLEAKDLAAPGYRLMVRLHLRRRRLNNSRRQAVNSSIRRTSRVGNATGPSSLKRSSTSGPAMYSSLQSSIGCPAP